MSPDLLKKVCVQKYQGTKFNNGNVQFQHQILRCYLRTFVKYFKILLLKKKIKLIRLFLPEAFFIKVWELPRRTGTLCRDQKPLSK